MATLATIGRVAPTISQELKNIRDLATSIRKQEPVETKTTALDQIELSKEIFNLNQKVKESLAKQQQDEALIPLKQLFEEDPILLSSPRIQGLVQDYLEANKYVKSISGVPMVENRHMEQLIKLISTDRSIQKSIAENGLQDAIERQGQLDLMLINIKDKNTNPEGWSVEEIKNRKSNNWTIISTLAKVISPEKELEGLSSLEPKPDKQLPDLDQLKAEVSADGITASEWEQLGSVAEQLGRKEESKQYFANATRLREQKFKEPKQPERISSLETKVPKSILKAAGIDTGEDITWKQFNILKDRDRGEGKGKIVDPAIAKKRKMESAIKTMDFVADQLKFPYSGRLQILGNQAIFDDITEGITQIDKINRELEKTKDLSQSEINARKELKLLWDSAMTDLFGSRDLDRLKVNSKKMELMKTTLGKWIVKQQGAGISNDDIKIEMNRNKIPLDKYLPLFED